MLNKYTLDGNVYQVDEEYEGDYPSDPDWYEYKVYLLLDGRIVDEWDSITECYNGIQKLSKSAAMGAVLDIEESVLKGEASRWFTFAD